MADKQWTEHFRWVTPILLTANLFFMGWLINITQDGNAKLFHHLTNAELHVPRSEVCPQALFEQYCKNALEDRNNIRSEIAKINIRLDNQYALSADNNRKLDSIFEMLRTRLR